MRKLKARTSISTRRNRDAAEAEAASARRMAQQQLEPVSVRELELVLEPEPEPEGAEREGSRVFVYEATSDKKLNRVHRGADRSMSAGRAARLMSAGKGVDDKPWRQTSRGKGAGRGRGRGRAAGRGRGWGGDGAAAPAPPSSPQSPVLSVESLEDWEAAKHRALERVSTLGVHLPEELSRVVAPLQPLGRSVGRDDIPDLSPPKRGQLGWRIHDNSTDSGGSPSSSHRKRRPPVLSEEFIAEMKKKLQSVAYQALKQDLRLLFAQYDKDKSGELDLPEFTLAVRKGGKVPTSKIPDGDLKALFRAIDDDGSGGISINELIAFVWGSDGYKRSVRRKVDLLPIGPTTEEVAAMKLKLQSLRYQAQGHDPKRLFAQFDKDKR